MWPFRLRNRAQDRELRRAVPARTEEDSGTSSSARPAARGSVAAHSPGTRGAVKSNPPIPPPPRRAVARGSGDEEYEDAVEERRPPPPPPPRRFLQPPPEPKNPPKAKAKAAEARPLQRGTDQEIAEAEAHLASVMAQPNATRTAKRKARKQVREAKGEPPPD